MTGKYKINGTDIYTGFGLVAGKGMYNELLKLAKPKKGYEYSWPDEDGTERDLSIVRFESRQLNLPFILRANNESDFYSKYGILQSTMYSVGRFDFDVSEMNRRFKLLYQDMTSFDKLTIIKNSSKILCKLSISVTDDFPTEIFTLV